MNPYYLSLGSNIHPEKNIPACILLLKQHFHVTGVSVIYETDPVGPAGKFKFWNCVVGIETPEMVEELIQGIRKIEDKLGRIRSGQNKFEPRTIDIDILPQPDYENLAFIMIPLAEIAPDDIDPKSGEKFSELANKLAHEKKTFVKIKNAEKR